MPSAHLTLPDLAAVYPYMRFKKGFVRALDISLRTLRKEGLLAALGTSNPKWEQAHQRMGYRITPGKPGYFAFFGIHHGAETVLPDVPDLYFFVEAPRGSETQRRMDATEAELRRASVALNQRGQGSYWGFTPGGYEGVWVVMSLLDALRSPTPESVITDFFRDALQCAADIGVIDLCLNAPNSSNMPNDIPPPEETR